MQPDTAVLEGVAWAPLRNEPVQARSSARLVALLDAAASVVDDIGYERLTTAMVAERAGSSIGTVYRYFPDRIAVLQALSSRHLSKFTADGVARVDSPANSTWMDTVDAALQYWLDAFRTEPGFRSLRFGDVLDLQPRIGERTNTNAVATTIASVLASRHGFTVDDDLVFDIEVALTVCDALLARAFAHDSSGDERFVGEALSAARDYLAQRYQQPITG